MEKKDNMGLKSSGAGAIKFDYFKEMDEIFAQDPDVQPVSTSSNLRGIQYTSKTSVNEENSCSDEEIAVKKPKKNRSKSAKEVSMLEKNFAQREDKKDQRHNELIARQDAALKILENIANSLCAKSKN